MSTSGNVLLGWPADESGVVGTYPRDTTVGLEPVQVVANQLEGTPTTEVELAANLPATSTAAGSTATPEIVTIEYFDNLGKPKR